MFKTFLLASKRFRQELEIYKRVVFDKRTPFIAKLCYLLIIGYAIMPFDFITDFLPIIGQLDDFILIPLLFVTARAMTPKHVLDEYRSQVLIAR